MNKHNKVILVVDQSLPVLERMVPLLEEQPGVEYVVHAGSFREAAGLLDDIRPDLLLLDIDLPEGTGISLLKMVREKYRHVIVFIVTNMVSDQHRAVCRRLGASRFFDKSVENDLIPAAVAVEPITQ